MFAPKICNSFVVLVNVFLYTSYYDISFLEKRFTKTKYDELVMSELVGIQSFKVQTDFIR